MLVSVPSSLCFSKLVLYLWKILWVQTHILWHEYDDLMSYSHEWHLTSVTRCARNLAVLRSLYYIWLSGWLACWLTIWLAMWVLYPWWLVNSYSVRQTWLDWGSRTGTLYWFCTGQEQFRFGIDPWALKLLSVPLSIVSVSAIQLVMPILVMPDSLLFHDHKQYYIM